MITVLSIISEIITSTFESFTFYTFLKKFKRIKTFTIYDFLSIMSITLVVLFLTFFVKIFSPINLIIINVFWFFWSLYFNNLQKVRHILFQLLLISTIFSLADSLSFFPALAIFNLDANSLLSLTVNRIIAGLICETSSFLIMKCVFSFNFDYLIENLKYMLSVSLLFISYIVSIYILSFDLLSIDSSLKSLSVSTAFIMLIINLIIIAVLHFLITFSNKYEHLVFVEQNYELQQHIINEQKLNINTIRSIQHEYTNNLSTINALLINNNIDEAKILLSKILNIGSKVNNSIKKTSFFEILVNHKLLEAKANNIKTNCSLNLPNDLPIDNLDIAILLNNTINNAIEACMKVDISLRYINLKVFVKGNYLNFYCENSCLNRSIKDNSELVTTKADKASHGFGIKNINSIIKKHDGFLKYSFMENKYILKYSLLIS